VNANHIVCLGDGKKLKMLKRHLMTEHGMTPEEYRERWGLKRDYPMVAPNYSAQSGARQADRPWPQAAAAAGAGA
jgi:predicted transcriptional regulator